MDEFITWSRSLAVDIASMDDQHRRLLAIFNELYRAMKQGLGKNVLSGVLDGLVDYTRTHFEHEESLMRLAGYPGLDAHRAEHEAFVRRLDELREGHRTDRLGISIDVFRFLQDWLVEHIQGSDRRYGPFLRERGIG